MKTSESITALAAAFSLAQAEMGGVEKNKENPAFKSNGRTSKYADLAAVVEVVKLPFFNHGLSYMQFPINTPEGMGCSTRIMHSSGEWIESEFTMPLGKVTAHGAGSNFTYARRYALSAACGIPVQDDDGNAASLSIVPPLVLINSDQVSELQAILTETDSDVIKFCQWANISSIDCLAAIHFDQAMAGLSRKKKAFAEIDNVRDTQIMTDLGE